MFIACCVTRAMLNAGSRDGILFLPPLNDDELFGDNEMNLSRENGEEIVFCINCSIVSPIFPFSLPTALACRTLNNTLQYRYYILTASLQPSHPTPPPAHPHMRTTATTVAVVDNKSATVDNTDFICACAVMNVTRRHQPAGRLVDDLRATGWRRRGED